MDKPDALARLRRIYRFARQQGRNPDEAIQDVVAYARENGLTEEIMEFAKSLREPTAEPTAGQRISGDMAKEGAPAPDAPINRGPDTIPEDGWKRPGVVPDSRKFFLGDAAGDPDFNLRKHMKLDTKLPASLYTPDGKPNPFPAAVPPSPFGQFPPQAVAENAPPVRQRPLPQAKPPQNGIAALPGLSEMYGPAGGGIPEVGPNPRPPIAPPNRLPLIGEPGPEAFMQGAATTPMGQFAPGDRVAPEAGIEALNRRNGPAQQKFLELVDAARNPVAQPGIQEHAPIARSGRSDHLRVPNYSGPENTELAPPGPGMPTMPTVNEALDYTLPIFQPLKTMKRIGSGLNQAKGVVDMVGDVAGRGVEAVREHNKGNPYQVIGERVAEQAGLPDWSRSPKSTGYNEGVAKIDPKVGPEQEAPIPTSRPVSPAEREANTKDVIEAAQKNLTKAIDERSQALDTLPKPPMQSYVPPSDGMSDETMRKRTQYMAQLALAGGIVAGAGPGWREIGQGFQQAAAVYSDGFDRYQKAMASANKTKADIDYKNRVMQYNYDLEKAKLGQRRELKAMELRRDAINDAYDRVLDRFDPRAAPDKDSLEYPDWVTQRRRTLEDMQRVLFNPEEEPTPTYDVT